MSSDSRIGTPASISDAKVCEKRASATLWISGPKIGGLSLNASHFKRPWSVLIQRRSNTTPVTITAATRTAQGLRMIFEIPMMIKVGVGSLAFSDANSLVNTGTMKMRSARKMTTITETTTAG